MLAASSLTDAFGELDSSSEERNPGTDDVQVSFAGSSELLTQIQQGAPAAVFASADEAKMNTAVKQGLVIELETFVRNRPAAMVPADNPAGIEEFPDLTEVDAQVVMAEDGAPIVEYTEDVLANADSSYGGDFEQRVLDKIVSREANVLASALRASLGEADATFVYHSDVPDDIRDRVRGVEIPENLNVLVSYPVARTQSSQNPGLAQEWIDLVLGNEGQAVLDKYRFHR